MARTIVFLVAVASGLWAQQGERLTASMFNGRWWSAAPKGEKYTYILGVRDGGFLAESNATTQNPGLKLKVPTAAPKGFSLTDTEHEIDAVYADTENTRIPVVMILQYVNKKVEGSASKSELEQELRRLRLVVRELK